MSLPAFTDHFAPLAGSYDVVLSDVWGVVHNGVVAFADACDALARFRADGGTVVLITNAPRQNEFVVRLLDKLAVPREAYDSVVSSGDVTRAVIEQRQNARVFHIGPHRDNSVFTGLDVRFASVEEADYAVCTGLFDDVTETPEDYRPLVKRMKERGLWLVCANPDLVVDRGGKLVYCAGAIAELYQSLGGEVLYAGKPHRPIYDAALARAAAVRGSDTPPGRVLAIGDSVRTDVAGASALGIDCLFVTGGIHAEELGAHGEPDPDALADILGSAGVKAVTRRLAW
jgi:HAD superfamily hydrolase (TIGR01459 family)